MNNENKRAGEISPVLRWVKASERTPPDNRLVFFKAIFPENIIHMRSGHWDGRWFNCNSGYYKVPWPDYSIEWLEEAPPIPAPEVKEEKGFYCDAEKNGAGRCSMICRMCYEEAPPACPEPVKEDQYDQWHPQDYSGKNAPVEQIAHVPDPKGEISEEIKQLIENMWSYGGNTTGSAPYSYKNGAIAMYRKMTANGAKSLSYWIVKARDEQISNLTSERDIARQENESLIASVEGWESKYHRVEEDLQKMKDIAARLTAKLDIVEQAKQALIDDLDEKNCEKERYVSLLRKMYKAHNGGGITQELDTEIYNALP